MTFGKSPIDVLDWTILATELYLIYEFRHIWLLKMFLIIRFIYILMFDVYFDFFFWDK